MATMPSTFADDEINEKSRVSSNPNKYLNIFGEKKTKNKKQKHTTMWIKGVTLQDTAESYLEGNHLLTSHNGRVEISDQ